MDDTGQGRGPSTRHRAPGTDDEDAEPGEDRERRVDERPGQGLSDHTQKRIGLHLRAMYDTIVQQPVPDRFRDLIAQLDVTDDGSTT